MQKGFIFLEYMTTFNRNKFASDLMAHLMQQGNTYEKISKATGLSTCGLWGIVNKDAMPRMETFVKLCDQMGRDAGAYFSK